MMKFNCTQFLNNIQAIIINFSKSNKNQIQDGWRAEIFVVKQVMCVLVLVNINLKIVNITKNQYKHLSKTFMKLNQILPIGIIRLP